MSNEAATAIPGRPHLDPLADFVSRAQEQRSQIRNDRAREVFDRAIAALNPDDIKLLQEEFSDRISKWSDNGLKYLDIPRYLRLKSHDVVRLDLDRSERRRVLDLGSGGGHFLFCCKAMNHDVHAVDKSIAHYDQLLKIYGIDVSHQTILFDRKLPVAGQFDLITIMGNVFNRLSDGAESEFWRRGEWNIFLDGLREHLAPDGQVFFLLNAQPASDGSRQSDAVLSYLADRGASVDARAYTAFLSAEALANSR